MTLTTSSPQDRNAPMHARTALSRVLRPDATADERFLLLEGPAGSGRTGTLAAAAAAARADGLDVVELRASDGDPTVTTGSLDTLVAMLSGAPSAGRLVLVDDLDLLDAAARDRILVLLIQLSHRARTVAVASVTDRRRVAGWSRLPHLQLDGAADRSADTWSQQVDDRLRSGAPHDALALLIDAAESSSSALDRGGAIERAVPIAGFLGEFAVAERLLRAPDAPVGGVADATAGWMRAVRTGEVREARSIVLHALERRVEAGSDEIDVLVATLQILCFLRGDDAWWDDAVAMCSDRDLDPVLRLVELCAGGADATGARSADQDDALIEAARRSVATGEPWKRVSLHVAWSLLDALDPRRERVDELLRATHAEHDLPALLACCRRGVAAFQSGRLDAADGELGRARSMATDLGAQTFVALVDAFQAILHSIRGDRAGAAAKADDAARWALRHGAPLVARAADQARASLDLALGRFEEAYARAAAHPTGSRWLDHGYGPVELLDAVECAARLRLPAQGRALVDEARAAVGDRPSPRQRMILAAATAVLDEQDGTRLLFETALGLVPAADAPFETARVRLAYGEWLRRSMHALEARLQFRLAASAFESLGAEQWRVRAQHELRAAGGAPDPGRGTEGVELSEQEHRVAQLAAAGLSNKQIASRLYLSPRTVSGHLYRIFPKLGVTSRAALRDALVGLQTDRG